MDYQSNLAVHDLRPGFKHIWQRPHPSTFGHDMLSDWADKPDSDPVFGAFKTCGFLTRDEAAIVYHCAFRAGGSWVDIGAATGWSASHLALAAESVIAVEPMFADAAFHQRFRENLEGNRIGNVFRWTGKSDEFFAANQGLKFTGVLIDGDHASPHPLQDAQLATDCLLETGVILLHDCNTAPVQEAVMWLLQAGFQVRIYRTPLLLACCWRGDFSPPRHDPDPQLPAMHWPAMEGALS